MENIRKLKELTDFDYNETLMNVILYKGVRLSELENGKELLEQWRMSSSKEVDIEE